MSDNTDEDLVTVPQLAKRLKVKPSWVYTAAESGRIPALKVGKYWRFKPTAVLKQLTKPTKP